MAASALGYNETRDMNQMYAKSTKMAASVLGCNETHSMDPAWKLQICRELRRRDKVQLGNYDTRLLTQQEKEKVQENKLHIGEESKDKQGSEQMTCPQSQMPKRVDVTETLSCSCCKQSQKLKEENETLLNRLQHNEHEYERLLSRIMEEKLKEAKKMNQICERMKRSETTKEERASSMKMTCGISEPIKIPYYEMMHTVVSVVAVQCLDPMYQSQHL
ncbi:golgin subfamily A member 6-like protein 4 isoform X2 [Dendropsophus ebraccatus]|uniref:golgin subfamily A member 6-like protein 4 isoform X2 n=1 Tax=Dendropsophus ebraccatus TaxID=150705 RepID=UPI003831F730